MREKWPDYTTEQSKQFQVKWKKFTQQPAWADDQAQDDGVAMDDAGDVGGGDAPADGDAGGGGAAADGDLEVLHSLDNV